MKKDVEINMEGCDEYEDADEDLFEEPSIFHTREPRDPSVHIHLLLVLACFLSSLAVAVYCAEGGEFKFRIAEKHISEVVKR